MELRNIEYFLQLAKSEHVSATADFLNISQPSLSKHLRTLEKDVGVRLFDRIGNRIVLNKNGEEFAQYAGQAMDLLNTGIQSAKRGIYETKGSIHIAYSTYAPLITGCISEYSTLNPHITFQISRFDESVGVPSEQVDFLLNFTAYDALPAEHDDRRGMFWVPQPLFQESYALIYGPKAAERICRSPFNLSDLKDELFVTMTQSGIFFTDITMPLCMNAGFFPKIYCQTDEFIVKVKLVQADQAIAFVSESCLQDALRLAPGLNYIVSDSNIAKRTLNLLRHKKVLMTEAALDFWDFVLDFYGLPADPWD